MLATRPHPYPVGVPRTRTLREIRDAYVALPPGAVTGEQVAVAGRVIFLRDTGKLWSSPCLRCTRPTPTTRGWRS